MIPVIINGIINPTDAMAAVRLGVSGLGFHLHESNPRYIEYSLVKSLTEKLPNTLQIFVEPDRYDLASIREVTTKLKVSSVFIPVSIYTPEFESLGCTITLKDSADTLLNYEYPHSGFTVMPDDKTYTGLLDEENVNADKWREINQQHHLLLTSDIQPEELLDALDFFCPAGLILEGVTESQTGLQDYSLIQEYVAVLGKFVTYV